MGDCHGYLWRNGRIQQITKDQSLVAKMVEEGAIAEEEASFHPRRNVILYSLGSERSPKIDLFEETLYQGDILFLCSDGLTRHVADEEIALILGQESPEAATKTLIRKANERGGEDNISVAVIRYEKETAVDTTQPDKTNPQTVVVAAREVEQAAIAYHPFLRVYTLALGMIQTVLIFLVWLLLRV